MRSCVECGTKDFDDYAGVCNVCPPCNGRHDADLWWRAYSKIEYNQRQSMKHHFVGDLSGLSSIERAQFMDAFNQRANYLDNPERIKSGLAR